jgi:Domain of unknown function (DUF4381)
MKPSMTDIHDIKPALAMGHDLRWLYWALAALAVLALAALVWRRWRKRARPAAADATAPLLPPDTEALQLLDALAADGDLDPKQFYFRLSTIIRRYIERRFAIPAAEMTTEELLPRVDRLPVEPQLLQNLKTFCRAADPIKFAGAPADANRLAHDLAFARDFVHRSSVPAGPASENADEDPPPASEQREPSKLLALNRGFE